LTSWSGVWTQTATGQRLKILSAQIGENANPQKGEPGVIVDRSGMVACGTGTLSLLLVQPENAKAMDFAAALNGGYVKIGTRLL
jgi:methionyl-tRNA formyltransferase